MGEELLACACPVVAVVQGESGGRRCLVLLSADGDATCGA